jgi:Na+-transporting NADH:ubiquinone oxidoreductase subunit C
MAERFSARYTILFAATVAAVCSVFVASSVIFLRPLQAENRRVDRMRNVLVAAGLIERGAPAEGDEIQAIFERRIQPMVVELERGTPSDAVDPLTYDQRRAATDDERSRAVAENPSRIRRVPRLGAVYQVRAEEGEAIEAVVLPVHGAGLWGQMYGYLALQADGRTIRGISFYEHQETPGLGAEIENPRWTEQWVGRQTSDESGELRFEVAKGEIGPPEDDPYRVDALTGATMTSDGVTALVRFWSGEEGYGAFLERLRGEQGGAL